MEEGNSHLYPVLWRDVECRYDRTAFEFVDRRHCHGLE